MIRAAIVASSSFALVACTISQNVVPVQSGVAAVASVCIIEDPAVRAGFVEEFRRVLTERAYEVKMLPPGASTTACPIVSTYVARWSWDLTIYLSYARILVFDHGVQAGEAIYDARKGGGRLDKFINAEPKIRELVEELFPPAGS